MHRIIILTICLVLAVLVSGCSLRNTVIDQAVEIAEAGIAAFEQDDDLRMVESAIPAHIKLLEVMLASRPGNDRQLVLLSQLYASYGFLFDQGRLDAANLGVDSPMDVNKCADISVEGLTGALDRYYLKGAAYALQALETRHANCREMINDVARADAFFGSLDHEDIPALFWYGFNQAAYVNLHMDSVKTISRAHLAEKAMLRVLALDPEYYHGMANLVLMMYYGSRSPMTGGNPEAAKKYYRDMKRAAGNDFILVDVYFARYVLCQAQDRNGFEKMLTRIIENPVSVEKFNLYNQAAMVRAKIYLGAVNDLFY